MTNSELQAVKWIKEVRDNAVVKLAYIAQQHLIYAGKKEKAEIIAKAFEELEQYRAIGTVKECQAAVERQTAKAPDTWGDGYDNNGNLIRDMYTCPNCKENYEIDYNHYKYCPNCGQAFDQSNLI